MKCNKMAINGEPRIKKVCFRVRKIYFDKIVNGEKREELRRFCEFWRKRLLVYRPEIAVFLCGKHVHMRKIIRFSVGPPEYFLGRELSEQGKKDIPTKDCIVTHLGDTLK